MSAQYWIEKRSSGLPRYRVLRHGKTFAALIGVSDETETRVEGKFVTRRGARKYIARRQWHAGLSHDCGCTGFCWRSLRLAPGPLMTVQRTIVASTANLDGKPPVAKRKLEANAHAVAAAPGVEQFVGWTEAWTPAAAGAVRRWFNSPAYRLIRPRKPQGGGMSVMGSWLTEGWRLNSSTAVKVSDPIWFNGKLISDERYVLVARFTTPEDRAFLLLVGHYNPDGTWAGKGALKVTVPARREAIDRTIEILGDGGAPALWLGDPNEAGMFLGARVERGAGKKAMSCRARYIGAGRVDRAVFIDGTTARWTGVAGNRQPYPANPGHPMGWLRCKGTLTWQ